MNKLITLKKPEEEKYKYKPEYCQMLLDYAYNNINIEGFFGEYMIPKKISAHWESLYPEWSEALELAEYRVSAGLNKTFQGLLEFAKGDRERQIPPNIDLYQKVIFRMADLSYKFEKDSGVSKQKGQEKISKIRAQKKNFNSELDPLALQIAELLKNK